MATAAASTNCSYRATTNVAARRPCSSGARSDEAGDTVGALHGDFEFSPVFRRCVHATAAVLREGLPEPRAPPGSFL